MPKNRSHSISRSQNRNLRMSARRSPIELLPTQLTPARKMLRPSFDVFAIVSRVRFCAYNCPFLGRFFYSYSDRSFEPIYNYMERKVRHYLFSQYYAIEKGENPYPSESNRTYSICRKLLYPVRRSQYILGAFYHDIYAASRTKCCRCTCAIVRE